MPRERIGTATKFTPAQALLSSPGVLTLQRLAGNRATTQLIQKANRIPTVQRADPVGGLIKEREGPNLDEIVEREVGNLPQLEDGGLPQPERVEAAKEEAGGVQGELGELGLGRGGALDEWAREEQGGAPRAEAAKAVVDEVRESEGDVDLPEQPQPSRTQRVKSALSSAGRWAGKQLGSAASWVGGKASSAGKWLRGVFSRENRRDAGAKASVVGGVGAPVAGHAGDIMNVGQSVVDNPATRFSADVVGGSGATSQLHDAGTRIGQTASAASPPAPTMEHPGDFAHSFSAGGFDLVHAVAGVAGLFFSALKAAMDIRSLVSSIRVIRGLKEAKRSALAQGASPHLVAAVDYAIRQKYEKVVKRAIGGAAALAGLGVGLAILIANPAGAALAAMIIGGIGAAAFMYKVGRWAWKTWKSKDVGKKRAMMARRLFKQIGVRNPLAMAAVRSLHLDPDKIAADPKGAEKIARKLKSA